MSKPKKKTGFFTKCAVGSIPNFVIILLILAIIVIGIYIYIKLHKTRIDLESCRSSCSIE